MTARANSLTIRAVRKDQGRWTAPANELSVFVHALAELGHDRGVLLAAAGVDEATLNDHDARVPCESFGAMFACAQRRRFTTNLAVELARRTPLGAYPLLDYLVVTCDTAGAGVEQLARYFRITTNPLALAVCDDDDPIDVRVTAPSPIGAEYLVSLMAFHLRLETDGRFALSEVMLRHQPDDAAAMSEAFGCTVRTPAAWDGVRISREHWRLPLRRRDPVLRRVLETQADDLLERLPLQPTVAAEVRRALSRRIALRDARIGTIARTLGTSARSLQRRLAVEGVRFQTLLEEARKEAAAGYCAGSSLSLAEIAYLVGYSEPAPFHRAFKQWFGVTPDGFRKRALTKTSSTPPGHASGQR